MPDNNQAEYRRLRRAVGKDKKRYPQKPENLRAASKRYRERHPDRVKPGTVPASIARQRAKQFRAKCKIDAFQHYGGKCYCCGETEPLLLGLDHIAGNGNIHRKEIKHERLCVWAKRNNWPPIFRVACHSCNLGSHLNGGICPHQKTEAQMTTFM